jgi:hypothetical protein
MSWENVTYAFHGPLCYCREDHGNLVPGEGLKARGDSADRLAAVENATVYLAPSLESDAKSN